MRKILPALYFLLPFALPEGVLAHAFGQQYTLPLPTWIFIYGGSIVVALSFLIITVFFGQKSSKTSIREYNLAQNRIIRAFISPASKLYWRVIIFAFYLLLIISGFLGIQDSSANIGPTLFWIIFVLGFTYLSILIGNFWSVVSPFSAQVDLIEKLTGKQLKALIVYPSFLSYWPAVGLYFLLIYNELLTGGQSAIPKNLSVMVINYTFITLLGVVIFGKDWLGRGELFNVFFSLVGKLSPLRVENKKLILRSPVNDLLSSAAPNFSLAIFIIFMLASTAYDGFRGTLVWFDIEFRVWDSIQNYPWASFKLIETLGLILAPLVFLSAYLFSVSIMRLVSRSELSIIQLAQKFAYTLIPIALVYNIAHYYTLLLTQGQQLAIFISDPLGLGWNIFNTTSYIPNPAFIRADFVWYSQVFFIVAGHILAIYLAHMVAVKTFPNYRTVLVSQLPMMILMVGYTLTGLWILSQPFNNKF